MTDISHYTIKQLVVALRRAAPYSTTPDLLAGAADRLDPMQELADLWRAEDKASDQAAEIERLRDALHSFSEHFGEFRDDESDQTKMPVRIGHLRKARAALEAKP